MKKSNIKKIEKLLENYFKKLGEEAQSRKEYKNDIEYILSGGSKEWLKCRINDKLNLNHSDRDHWQKEWERHFGDKLLDQIIRPVKIDRPEKCFMDIMDVMFDHMPSLMNVSANIMASYTNSSYSKMHNVLDAKDENDLLDLISKSLLDCFIKLKNRK